MQAVFGPTTEPELHAGALVVGDARLLALPIRSLRGTFVWATSPLLLTLAERDLGTGCAIPKIDGREARVTREAACVVNSRVYLEDLDLPAATSPDVTSWASVIVSHLFMSEDILSKRFVVVDDETMSFFWQTATQVDARVRLDEETRTVAAGALWLEESLPPETILVGIAAADRSRRDQVAIDGTGVLDFAFPGEQIVQLGGKATIGRGRCRLVPLEAPVGRRSSEPAQRGVR